APALQLAFAGLGINTVAVHDRCTARAWRTLFVLKDIIDWRLPNFFCILRLKRMQHFLPILVIEIIDSAEGDYGRSEPFANGNAPDEPRLGRQFLRHPGKGRNVAGELGTSPLRPIFRQQWSCQTAPGGNQCQKRDTKHSPHPSWAQPIVSTQSSMPRLANPA